MSEFRYAANASFDMSRAVEYCPSAGKPFGFTNRDRVIPNSAAFAFIAFAKAPTLPE
jgi:hypothetical protein